VRFIRQFYSYYLSPDRGLARRLREILGFTPTRLSLYRLAFFHKSNNSTVAGAVPPLNDKPGVYRNNERLEYLGDAVLGTIVAEYLFKKYPLSDEGFLTKMRSKIVKRESLNKISEDMGLDVILAEYNNTRLSQAMLGNAFEALIGAIYLELGYHRTRKFIIARILRKYVDVHQLETFDDNYKSQLLEWSQKNGKLVTYKLIAKYKFEKRDRFKIAVLIDGEKIATADDFNKKSAEQIASEKAINSLGIKIEEEI
jgi:ribonuclease III